MEQFGLYLLKVSASIAAFYLLYYLLFRKEKFFAFNRLYLSSILIISLLIPLITFKMEVPIVQSINSFSIDSISESNLNDIKQANQSIEISRFDLWNIIKIAYLFACFFFLLRLIFGIYKAKQIIWRGNPLEILAQKVIVTNKNICPFSFFNKIVIPENLLNSNDLPMIIMHEEIHVKEKHFIDLHLSEFFLVFLWFNPFSWFINSAIRTNLEYSADDAVKNELYDLEEYQMAMVRLINSKHISPLANALNVSQLKNRIMMMKRKKQKKYPMLSKLTVIPLLFFMVLLLSAKERVEKIVDSEIVYIDGIVTDIDSEKPVPWIHVYVKDNPLYGDITDNEGKYRLPVNTLSDRLIYASFGYHTKEIEIKNRKSINVKMQSNNVVEIKQPKFPSKIINSKEETVQENQAKVKGQVRSSANNTPIPGVAVVVKGTTIGAITDKEGNYTISFPEENNVLVFALMGYKLKEVEINNKERIDVSMAKDEGAGVIINQLPDTPELGEIVIKGKVTESDGEKALGGISVIIKGKPTGTMTDKDGNYQIHVSKDDNKLVFISPDYQTQEIEISEIKEIDVKLVKK